MNKESCYEIGFVTKPHGLNGAVSITLDVDNPLEYQNLESVFLEISGRLIPFFISKIQIRDNSAIVEFEEINTRDQFEEIKSAKLFLPLNFLPQLPDDEFYYHEVIGFKVVDQNLGNLGIVSGFNTSGPQPIMVMDYKEKEILIPASKEIVIKPNKKEKTIEVNLPEGLLEIYLEEE
jgi:16S rRNA processing protein RimM